MPGRAFHGQAPMVPQGVRTLDNWVVDGLQEKLFTSEMACYCCTDTTGGSNVISNMVKHVGGMMILIDKNTFQG